MSAGIEHGVGMVLVEADYHHKDSTVGHCGFCGYCDHFTVMHLTFQAGGRCFQRGAYICTILPEGAWPSIPHSIVRRVQVQINGIRNLLKSSRSGLTVKSDE